MEGWEAWWEQALDDCDTFHVLSATTQHAAACFFAQQAAEKAVKAVLASRHQKPWGHSILHLVKGLDEATPVDAARKLDFYYVPTRYPDAFPEGSASEHFTSSDVDRARESLEEVLS